MLNTIEIEENLEQLVGDVAERRCTLHDFPFRLMEAYSASRNEVAKLRMKHPESLLTTDTLWPKRDCQEFRVWAGIMGKKESPYVPTQRTCDFV